LKDQIIKITVKFAWVAPYPDLGLDIDRCITTAWYHDDKVTGASTLPYTLVLLPKSRTVSSGWKGSYNVYCNGG